MKIYAVQMHIEPGRPEKNLETILQNINLAKEQKADLVVFPEMSVPGYLIGDLWEENSFVSLCVSCGEKIREAAKGIDVLFGNVARESETGENGRSVLYNAAFYASNQKFLPLIKTEKLEKCFLPKTLLPCYREFDEPRYFSDLRKLAAKNDLDVETILAPVEVRKNFKIGISICEDSWDSMYPLKPSAILAKKINEDGILINISCSPYTKGKSGARHRVFSSHAKKGNVPLLYLNSVGSQNNGKNIYAFEGDSCIYNRLGENIFSFPAFKEASFLFECHSKNIFISETSAPAVSSEIAMVKAALIFMIRENLKRFHISRIVIGASGGIDSAVSAALYTEAIGKENVFLVNMPTKFNSSTTKNAARKLAENLGCSYMVVPVSDIIESVSSTLKQCSFDKNKTVMDVSGIHFENLQARTRSASVLATVASILSAGFTCNGNKSEVAVGYCTLYGDTSGVLCALGDLWKTEVYALAEEINKEKEIIPQASIDIPASAELSDAQNVDEGKGDPIIYPYHDKLFAFWMEPWNRNGFIDSKKALEEGTLPERLGISESYFNEIFKTKEDALKDMEYWYKRFKGIALAKRIQMPPVLSVSRRAFGFDFRESQL